jgi:hypothetical protein
MEAKASSIPQTPVVVVPMPRPNGNGKMEGSAWPA